MKILILVLSMNEEPYLSLEQTIRETWGKEKLSEIEIFYYYGSSSSKKIIGDRIYSCYPEGFGNIGYKTLDAFDLIQGYKFDYLFRTNSSSYVIQKNLVNFLQDKPKQNYYSGINMQYNNINYCSGAGYFLSRDVFDKVIDNKNNWNHKLFWDDVSIGELIVNQLRIKINPFAKRFDINAQPYNLDLIKEHYHIRCKIENNRLLDSLHMKNIYNIINNL